MLEGVGERPCHRMAEGSEGVVVVVLCNGGTLCLCNGDILV